MTEDHAMARSACRHKQLIVLIDRKDSKDRKSASPPKRRTRNNATLATLFTALPHPSNQHHLAAVSLCLRITDMTDITMRYYSPSNEQPFRDR